jgi:phosphoribosylformimino-5-aminoimidazole carboxamide ribotide isomerase
MLILPAIDLLEGRVVRLRQGRFDEATVYSDDPLDVARRWIGQGAGALHLVDLEGARLGKAMNLEWIYRIRAELPDPLIQVGGGIRTLALASRLFRAGIDRIVCGTAAVQDPRLIGKLVERYDGDRIAAALDLRDGRVAVEGWESESRREMNEVLSNLEALEIRWIVCTDIARDGTLAGPGVETARRLIDDGFQVVVAGGVASVEDVRRLRELGAAGCIIGSALYEGALALPDALEAARAD